jgi:hypothetical protein
MGIGRGGDELKEGSLFVKIDLNSSVQGTAS